jgi:hypothetical protein
MEEPTKNAGQIVNETINNAFKSVKEMKESTLILLIVVVTLLIILIAIAYYFYYSFLRKRECTAMDTIYGEVNTKIRSVDTGLEDFGYTFKDYYIKSAYNCCSGGNYKNDYVDTCILKDVLKQGVRGLDFEIFSINDQPVVATSTSDSYYIKETFNYINFADIMAIIRDYAFASSTCPNPFDPIIIHLRIKSTNQEMYKNFAEIFKNGGFNTLMLDDSYSYECHGTNMGNVKLKDIMGKIVLIVDRSNTSFLECPEFYEYVNMTSNSVFMRALHYYDIKYTPDMNELIEFNKQNMTIGMPDKGSNPDNPSSIIMREMGCQLLGMRYPLIDTNIEENNIFFDESGYAFVLKPENLRYIPVTIDLPPPQNPELSYATRTVQSDFYKFDV